MCARGRWPHLARGVEIHVVETSASVENELDTLAAELLESCLVGLIIYEEAHGVAAGCQGCSVDAQGDGEVFDVPLAALLLKHWDKVEVVILLI